MASTDDILLDLNFVPAWARQPAGQHPYADFEGKRDNRRYGDRPPRDRDQRPARPPDRDRDRLRGGRDRGRTPDRRPAPAEPRPQARPVLPAIDVAFIPERHGLQPLAVKLRQAGKAFPLYEVAAMFFRKPEYYAVKLESRPKDESSAPQRLFQCAECRAIFLEREPAVSHGFEKHFEAFYAREEIRTDPPKGNFICVARCSLSGELLGPPNYHSFTEKVMELHSTRFAHLSLDEYRKKIVNVTDPALIEKWKQESCCQLTYRTLRVEPALTFKKLADARSHFQTHHAPGLFKEGSRFIVPGAVAAAAGGDPLLGECVREALQREIRFPLMMTIALRPAFRHLGFHIFKTSQKQAFITSICPHPIDPAQTTDTVRKILEHLTAHPGHTRTDIVHILLPDAPPESPPVSELVRAILWLVEKGHVVEFFNGTLAIPRRPAGLVPPTAGQPSCPP